MKKELIKPAHTPCLDQKKVEMTIKEIMVRAAKNTIFILTQEKHQQLRSAFSLKKGV